MSDEAKVLGGKPEQGGSRQNKTLDSTGVVVEDDSSSATVVVATRLPVGLKDDITTIITYLKNWTGISDFIRDAILNENKRWIAKAERKKRESEK